MFPNPHLRKIKFKMYNESAIMAFSFYNLSFFAILVAIISAVGMENNTEYIVSSSLIILGTAITIFSLFAQKFHFITEGTTLRSSGYHPQILSFLTLSSVKFPPPNLQTPPLILKYLESRTGRKNMRNYPLLLIRSNAPNGNGKRDISKLLPISQKNLVRMTNDDLNKEFFQPH